MSAVPMAESKEKPWMTGKEQQGECCKSTRTREVEEFSGRHNTNLGRSNRARP